MLGYIIGCASSLVVGILIGAKGYYLYANHLYMRYPELFMDRLEQKIRKKQESDTRNE